jgi:hypothetical protein
MYSTKALILSVMIDHQQPPAAIKKANGNAQLSLSQNIDRIVFPYFLFYFDAYIGPCFSKF